MDDQYTRVLIIGDSRCKLLCSDIRAGLKIQGPDIPIWVEAIHKGGLDIAGLLDLIEKDYIPQHGKYDFIYFFGGVNNLSELHPSGKITAVYDDVGHLVDSMFNKLESARNILFKYSYRPIICQLMGLNFDTYNKLTSDQTTNQRVIDEAIPVLNHAINSLNTDIEAVSPWLGSTVHAVIHKKFHHKYLRLEDGLHPTNEMINIWVKCFVNAILKNYAWKE